MTGYFVGILLWLTTIPKLVAIPLILNSLMIRFQKVMGVKDF